MKGHLMRKGLLAAVALAGVEWANAANLSVPKGVAGDPETIEDAARVVLPSRTEISLNGLWRSRPVLDDEAEIEISDATLAEWRKALPERCRLHLSDDRKRLTFAASRASLAIVIR